MALQSSGAISFDNLRTEYGNGGSIALSEMYRGGPFVLDHSNNIGVPTSGIISLSNFYGANNTAPVVTHTTTQTNGSSGGKLVSIGFTNLFGSSTDSTIDFLGGAQYYLWYDPITAGSQQQGTHLYVNGRNTGWTSVTIGGTTLLRTDFTSTGTANLNPNFWIANTTNHVGAVGSTPVVVFTQ
jgi:hypothetical protein